MCAKIRILDEVTLKKAVSLKIRCWTEELDGKAENTLSFDEEYAFWKDWICTARAHQDIRLVIGAYQDDTFLGFAGASLAEVEDLPSGGIELNMLFVDEKARGMRVSYRLLEAIAVFFLDKGYSQMVIYSHHYAPSNAYYRKLGAQTLRQDLQMDGKLLVDVFQIDLEMLRKKVSEGVSNFNFSMELPFEDAADEFTRFLDKTDHMVLATSENDRVTARMMSFVHDGIELFFQTDAEFLKTRQMRSNPLVAICQNHVQIEGTAQELGHPSSENCSRFIELYREKHPGSYSRYSTRPQNTVFRVFPNRVMLWKYIHGEPYRDWIDFENKKAWREAYR